MKWIVENRILHGIYEKKEIIPDNIQEIANEYEGLIKERIGWNIPMSFVKKHHTRHYLTKHDAEYIIIYRRGDIQTKRHELQHAKYAMEEEYRDTIKSLWESFTDNERKQITAILLKMKYPDREEILVDEFQAYYFTEKPNFFGLKQKQKAVSKTQ